MTKKFQELIVWQKGHEFVLNVYRFTSEFPKEEIYGITSQFRRAAVSCPANIAEGYPKKGKLDKLRYFNIAQGSLEECRYYCILSKDLGYINEKNYLFLDYLVQDISKLLVSYMNKIADSR